MGVRRDPRGVSAMSPDQSIREHWKVLLLPIPALCYDREAEIAAKVKLTYHVYLCWVLQQQVVVRVDNCINAKLKKANFSFIKTLRSMVLIISRTFSKFKFIKKCTFEVK